MPITVQDLLERKRSGQKLAMLTAYDGLLATAFDEAGVPLILVGDTLGIFVMGWTTTIPVTLDMAVHHCQAVSANVREALVVGDLPFGSYEVSNEQGTQSAIRLMKEGGAAMVKLEGPRHELVHHLATHGVPVMGHLGLTPQSFHAMGGHRVQARTQDAVDRLIEDARGLEAAGASACVLEGIPTEAARRVTEALVIPTIGIGAGPHCDGQVLVGPEMLGLSAGPRPRFAKRFGELRPAVMASAEEFVRQVAEGTFPDPEHSYDWSIKAPEA